MKNDYAPQSFCTPAVVSAVKGENSNVITEVNLLLLMMLFFFSVFTARAQYCGPNVPTFNVNLTGNPNGSWISPATVRNDNCCGSTAPDVCVQFIVTLDPASTGIIFNIFSGAVPPGALYYQINCGPPTPVGQPICLTGVGPHTITFCKPGNNSNQYIITSMSAPSFSGDIVLNDGCSGMMGVTGMDEATVTWNSIYPGGPGDFNGYLSCTQGCDTTTVTAQSGAPPYVDYRVCGVPIGGCSPTPSCDTIRVYFNPTLAATIVPTNPTICYGNTGVTITASPSGGSPPYDFSWSTGATTQSVFVGPGTYTVTVGDTSNCPGTTATVTVTAFTNPITANAGPDQSTCAVNPVIQLSGVVTGASGGIWSGGSGTFSPNNTTLNATYTPSASEISSGIVTLTLITTGNGTCPADTDVMVIHIHSFQGTAAMSHTNVTCNGYNNGTASVAMSGGTPPYTYSWNTSPAQSSATATGLAPGTYTVTITDGNGCTATQTMAIAQPPPLVLNTAGFNASCYNACNGQGVVIPSGGNGNYTFSWAPVSGSGASLNNLCAGIYTVTVTDAMGCSANDTAIVNQPQPLVISTSSVAAHCMHADGSASASVSGGTQGYTYTWMPGNQSGSTATGLIPGTYTITVTDFNGCTSTAQVIVGNAPGVTASMASVTNVSCFGMCNGSATVSASGGNGPYIYSWTTSPTQASAAATGLCAGAYSVYITDANSCTAMAVVNITQPAQVVLSGLSQPATICIGQSITLTASASGGSGSYTFSWSPAGPTVSPMTTTTYTVNVTDMNGCTAMPQSVTVTVNPPLSLVVSGNSQTCQGVMITLTASASGGNGGPYQYVWMPGNLTGSTVHVSPTATTTYTVTATDNCSPSVAASKTVTVPQPPAVSFTANNTSGCSGMCALFTSNSPSAVAWNWSFGDGGFSSIANPQHCYSNAGSYSVSLTVTDANGCSSMLTTPNMLTVHVNPTANFTMGPQPTTILEPRICFTDLSSPDVNQWYWNFDDPNDLLTSTDQNPCHSYSDTGRYCATLIVHNQYGCWSTVTYCLMIQPYFAIYVPNAFTPNGDGLNDTFFPKGVSIDPNDYHMWIFDRWGKNIFETEQLEKGWDGRVMGGDEIVQIGVYVWKIRVKDHEGNLHVMTGSVSVIK